MRYRIGGLSVLLALGGCMAGPGGPAMLPPDVKVLSIDGVSFAAPTDGGWYVKDHSPYVLNIAKFGASQDESVVVSASLFKAPPPESGKDFVQQVKEAEEQDSPPPRFALKTHDVVPVSVGAASCARSHSLAEDHSPTVRGGGIGKMMIIEALSLNCRHPDDPKVGFNVTYSDRYSPGNADPDFMRKGMALLNSVQIMKLQE